MQRDSPPISQCCQFFNVIMSEKIKFCTAGRGHGARGCVSVQHGAHRRNVQHLIEYLESALRREGSQRVLRLRMRRTSAYRKSYFTRLRVYFALRAPPRHHVIDRCFEYCNPSGGAHAWRIYHTLLDERGYQTLPARHAHASQCDEGR